MSTSKLFLNILLTVLSLLRNMQDHCFRFIPSFLNALFQIIMLFVRAGRIFLRRLSTGILSFKIKSGYITIRKKLTIFLLK